MVQRDAVHIEMPRRHGSPVDRERGAEERIRASGEFHRGVRDGADIARGGGVEGGAVFDIKLTGALVPQPSEGRQRVADRLPGRLSPRFQGYHQSRPGI